MAAPNIVNVATITGVTTFIAGIAVTTRGTLTDGISTVEQILRRLVKY